MNRLSEIKSAAARLEVEKRLDLQKNAEAAVKAEKDEERQLEALKMARLRALRLAKGAAQSNTGASPQAIRGKKRP